MTIVAQRDEVALDLLLLHGPFPEALRTAIRARGLTLESLSRALRRNGTPVSLASLSHWQRGLHLPRRESWDRLCPVLDSALSIRPGTMRALLERASLPVDTREALLSNAEPAYLLVRDVIGAGEDTFWPPISIRQTANVSATGYLLSVGVSTLRQVSADKVDRACLIYVALDRRAPAAWQSSTHRVGKIATNQEQGSSAAELLLDEPLQRGTVVRMDSEVTWPDGPTAFSAPEPQRTVGHCLGSACRDYSLVVRFAPGVRPARVWRCWSPSPFGQDDRTELGDVPVSSNGVAQLTEVDPRPGTYSLHWTL